MLAALFLFCWLGPVVYQQWGETETDYSGNITYDFYQQTTEDGEAYWQVIVTNNGVNKLAPISGDHLLGTDEQGMDVFTRLMYGGRLSLTISFLAVFLTSALGIILGGISGYYGGWVDNVIMRLCDMLMCLPTLPLMLIIGTVLQANDVPVAILHISVDDDIIAVLLAGNGPIGPRSDFVPPRAGIHGRGGSDGIFDAEKNFQAPDP